jgi:hypothetical protein
MRENRTYGCVSSESWRVQWEGSPTEAKVRSLVAWIARRKETKSLKPIDEVVRRDGSESSGRNESERIGGLESAYPGAEPATVGRRQHGASQTDRSGVATLAGWKAAARWQGRAKRLEKPSSPRCEIGGAGKPYNRRTREIGGRREGGGGTRSSDEAE